MGCIEAVESFGPNGLCNHNPQSAKPVPCCTLYWHNSYCQDVVARRTGRPSECGGTACPTPTPTTVGLACLLTTICGTLHCCTLYCCTLYCCTLYCCTLYCCTLNCRNSYCQDVLADCAGRPPKCGGASWSADDHLPHSRTPALVCSRAAQPTTHGTRQHRCALLLCTAHELQVLHARMAAQCSTVVPQCIATPSRAHCLM
jgi:hypothetical protein